PVEGERAERKGAANHSGFLGSPEQLGVDGLIILTQRISPETIQHLASRIPIVCSHLLPLPNVSCIAIDAVGAVFEATRHLLQLGHRRIAVMAKDFTDVFGRAAREGARLAMSTITENTNHQALQL